MEVLFMINILFFIFITYYKIYYLSNFFRMGFLNPISIPFLVSIPVLIMTTFVGPFLILDKGLFNKWFNMALFTTNLSITISFVVIYLTLYFSKRSDFIKNKIYKLIPSYTINRKRMIYSGLIFFFFFCVFFFLLTKDFGILNWISNPRLGYQFHRAGNGHWYALSLLFLSTSYTIFMLYAKHINQLLSIFLVFIFFVFFLGSKGHILFYSIFFLIILWLRQSKYFLKFILWIPLLAFLMILFNFNPSDLIQVISYFDHYINSSMYFEAYFKNEIDLFYGEIMLTEFYEYIPRFLYPDKPYVYGILLVNEFFWPGLAEHTHTPAFGGPISIFADFGFLGLIIFSFFDISIVLQTILLFILYTNIDINKIRMRSTNLYLFIWMLAPSFMIFFGIFYSLILFYFIIKVISISNRIKI